MRVMVGKSIYWIELSIDNHADDHDDQLANVILEKDGIVFPTNRPVFLSSLCSLLVLGEAHAP